MKLSARNSAIVTTVYAGIFSYPLTPAEVSLWAVKHKGSIRPSDVPVLSSAKMLRLRVSRERASQKKWRRAFWVSRWLRLVPTIQLVGITGGLAMNNAGVADDIDFFIVAKHGTLWMTRLATIIVVHLLGVRRGIGVKRVADLICLNMFLDEQSLALPRHEQDLFAAHEVVQMRPLWERGRAYRKFLFANKWVRMFLPNAWADRKKNYELGMQNYESKNTIVLFLLRNSYFVIRFFEPLARFIQLRHMAEHRTTEIITDRVLRFHPHDARVWVRQKLALRLKKYNIPLDSVFYHRLK